MSCDKTMTFEECELAVLRSAVDKMEKKSGSKMINDPDIQDIIRIVEDFLKVTKRICYGGTAINNILPLEDQFYDKSVELPIGFIVGVSFISGSLVGSLTSINDSFKK